MDPKERLQQLKQAVSGRKWSDSADLQAIFDDLKNVRYMDIEADDRGLLAIVRQRSCEDLNDALNRQIIVSLTTYPKRITTVHKTIETILKQTMPADKIILWLAEEEFPGGLADLPDTLKDLAEAQKISVEWCRNLLPHKKYFYAMQKYREAIIITVDDDLYFPEDMIETLFYSYLRHPDAVSAMRTHLMTTDENGHILPYVEWVHENIELSDLPMMELFATNGAGALFPPHVLDTSLFDEERIMKICPYADDMWLKVLEILDGVMTVQPKRYIPLQYVEDTQDEGIWKNVNSKGQNDIQLSQIKDWVDEQFGPDYLENRLIENKYAHDTRGVVALSDSDFQARKTIRQLNKKIDQLQKASTRQKDEMRALKNSLSFRIGRFLTFLPRKIKSLLKVRS